MDSEETNRHGAINGLSVRIMQDDMRDEVMHCL
jgi:hypothetical protein